MISHDSVETEATPFPGLSLGIALLALAGLCAYIIFNDYIAFLYPYSYYPLYFTLGVGGVLLIFELVIKLVSLEKGADILAGIAIIASIILEDFLAGSIVVFIVSIRPVLEYLAVKYTEKQGQVRIISDSFIASVKSLTETTAMFFALIAFVIAIAAWFFSGLSERFLAVLVVATPIPILFAVPLSLYSSSEQSAKSIALQGAVAGSVLSLIGMLLAAFGFLIPVDGAIFRGVIDLLMILNFLRKKKTSSASTIS